MSNLLRWQAESLPAELAERMVQSLYLLVEYTPGNGKKVSLDWYVDCEIYKKPSAHWMGCKKGKTLERLGYSRFSSKEQETDMINENSKASPNSQVTREFG